MGLERGVVQNSPLSLSVIDDSSLVARQKGYAREYVHGFDIFQLLAEETIVSGSKGEDVFFLYGGFHRISRKDYLNILTEEMAKRPH